MGLLQIMKHIVSRLQSHDYSLFQVPVERQKAFLESLPEPEAPSAHTCFRAVQNEAF